MVQYNPSKYLKYKKKQELLNRAQINLVLDKHIAEALQRNAKGINKAMFEHQLKCYLLEKMQSTTPVSYNQHESLRSMQYINIFIIELRQELKQMSETTKKLEETIRNFFSRYNQDVNDTQLVRELQLEDSPKILNPYPNKYKKNKIPEKVLHLAIDLYETLNSWNKVCNQLAERGYLSSVNTVYTASSLSRAVSKYKSNL
uniref:Uncharacterized protein n=1 Tax=Grateloupia filicina TaxID=31455 RepID=A0A2S1FX64_9FLOR|nr:hypothetical protein Grafi_p229 [Grateloupia filicina]AWD77340.1 hypothetical protein Grafi_p229 [Grateloupia filicina]